MTDTARPAVRETAQPVWKDLLPAFAYWTDACQRTVLFLDVLRERGNIYRDHNAGAAPNVLDFGAELIRDGRTLPRPVNYLLVRIEPPEGIKIDPAKPPFIVVDPRAGHGPGIGGMKQDSEIGVALAAGHPCYFVGFLPYPVPGQTVEDVCRAEAVFVADVAARHPDANGKPVIIANCQAGWQIMMMAAINQNVTGPILLAGSPLSYWAGVRGKNPLRYLGGMLGGTWLTALAGDLGGGIFDGASLVANFESMNPANTHWQKPYNVYSKVDTEAARFLDFETWWGSPVLLNAEEMQSIADNLFVGNTLSAGLLRTSEGYRIDLRNVKSPIIVFCSWGDDITPPQQALGWVTDIYDDEEEIAENGQTIVYTLHQSIGHLGIFVSGKVASKEHSEFTACMDMIDLAPPGLYEAIITEVDPDTENPELIDGKYLFTLHRRTLSDIRALGSNSAEDDLRFATVARVSEMNRGLYNVFLRPVIRPWIAQPAAAAMRQMHPNRMRFALFSDQNPAMGFVKQFAAMAREQRQPVQPDNPLHVTETIMSSWISMYLKTYGEVRDALTEQVFLTTYGSPFLQALMGLGEGVARPDRHMERDLVREAEMSRLRSGLEARMEAGGSTEALVRALIYVRAPGSDADERDFAMIKIIRASLPAEKVRTMAELKAILKEQSLLMRLDEEGAIAALPQLLPVSRDERRSMLTVLRDMIAARGAVGEEAKRRLRQMEALFEEAGRGSVPKSAGNISFPHGPGLHA